MPQQDAEGELFRLLVENVRDYALFVTDTQGIIRTWNPGAERLLGYTEDEIIGQSADIFFTPEDIQLGMPQKEMQAAELTGHGPDDRWHVRKGGARFWSSGMTVPLRASDGTTRGFAKIMRDRTEWKLQQDQYQLQSELLDTVGQAVIATKPDGTIFYWNRFAETLYGWRKDEVLGRNVREVTVPSEQSPAAEAVMRRMAAGESWSGEFHVRRRDGTTFPAYVTNTPIIDEHGSITAFVGVSADISERKQAEELLRQSEQRFRLVLESITDAFLAVDAEWRLTYVNGQAERTVRMRREDLIGRSLWELFPGLLGSIFEEPYRKAMAERTPRRIEGFYQPLDGWFEVNVYPMQGGGLSFSARDVSERNRAEKQFAGLTAASEQQRRIYETALSNTVDFNYVFDLQGRFTYVNKAQLDIWGKEFHEAAGKNFFELGYPPEVAARHQREIEQVIQTRQPIKNETAYATRSGERQYEYIFAPVLAADGTVEAVAGSTRDITERKEVERKLREQHDLTRTITENATTAIFMMDDKSCCTFMNPAAEQMTGFAFEEVNGEILHDFIHHHHPDGSPYPMSECPIDRALPEHFAVVAHEDVFIRKNGEMFPVLCNAKPIHRDGVAVGTVIEVRDITEQKRADEAARKRSEQVRRLADVATRVNVAADVRSVLGVVTEEARQLIGSHQAITIMTSGSDWSEAITTVSLSDKYAEWQDYDYKPDVSGIYSVVCRTNKPMRMTQAELEAHPEWNVFERNAGIHPPMRGWLAAPLVGRNGRNFGLIQLSDKSEGEFTEDDEAVLVQMAQMASVAIENARLVQDLRENDRRKDEFLATLAHELRNPLAPVHNSIQVLKMEHVDAETAQQVREIMERQVDQLVHLVDDLLDISRLMRGKIELRRERVDLASIIARAVETAQPLISAQHHQLDLSLPPAPLLLDADPVRLAQVIANLLTNAAKYMDAHGHIWLSARREGSEAVLSVRDSGIGIAPAMLPHVFDLFVQVDHSSTRAQGGLGIGLTLVRNLVERHHGTVEARSEGLGKGSEFVIRLPLLVQASQDPGQGGRGERLQQKKSSSYRLLVVDDNKDAAKSLGMLLRLQGHEVHLAHDGSSALREAASFHPHVVFLDLGMPKMDGYEVARRMRRELGLDKTVLAALTGWGQQEDRRRTAEAGFDHHLVKPPDPKLLENVLAALEHPERE